MRVWLATPSSGRASVWNAMTRLTRLPKHAGCNEPGGLALRAPRQVHGGGHTRFARFSDCRSVRIAVIGRYHGQFSSVNADSGHNHGWESRRMFLGVETELFHQLTLRVQVIERQLPFVCVSVWQPKFA
jgi:hypothetical protein